MRRAVLFFFVLVAYMLVTNTHPVLAFEETHDAVEAYNGAVFPYLIYYAGDSKHPAGYYIFRRGTNYGGFDSITITLELENGNLVKINSETFRKDVFNSSDWIIGPAQWGSPEQPNIYGDLIPISGKVVKARFDNFTTEFYPTIIVDKVFMVGLGDDGSMTLNFEQGLQNVWFMPSGTAGCVAVDGQSYSNGKVYTGYETDGQLVVADTPCSECCEGEIILVLIGTPRYYITFDIRDALTGKNLDNVILTDENGNTWTINSGSTLEMKRGTHILNISKAGYDSKIISLNVENNETVRLELYPEGYLEAFDYFGVRLRPIDFITTTAPELSSMSIVVVAKFENGALITKGNDWKLTYMNNTLYFYVNNTKVVNASLESNKTVLLATTYGEYMGKIFVNGKLVEAEPASVRITNQYNEIRINGPSTLYEVLLYNRVLSDEEIREIYEHPLDPPRDGLVLWYGPDSVDTAQNKWLDKSGNANDGQIYGASYVPLRPISEAQFSEAYELQFNSEMGQKIVVGANGLGSNWTQLSVIAIVRPRDYASVHESIVFAGRWDYNGWFLDWWVRNPADGKGYLRFVKPNGDLYSSYHYQGLLKPMYFELNRTYFLAATFNGESQVAKLYLDGEVVIQGFPFEENYIIPHPYAPTIQGDNAKYNIYLLLIYSRALSDEEIRQIYEHPLDPPRDGLVLFYSPYSYDPESGRWLNIAPIFSTIPLAEELDATNYGAEAVRVSIPDAHYFDIENNSEIPVENVSVSMLANNTTISLLPSLLTLPYNETVTLNVSASGYLPRLLQTPTSITSLAVYLYPAPSENSTTTPPNWTNNFTMPDINGTGWSGWQIGKEALSLNFDKAIQLFFTQNPNSKAQVFLPFAIWLGMTVLGLVFSQSPLVALTLGAITQASLAGLGAKLDMRLLPGVVTLYLFLFIWILKDFIESRKAD